MHRLAGSLILLISCCLLMTEVLPGALHTMQKTLSKASPNNPYNHLLAATVAYSADLRPVTIAVGSSSKEV